MRRLLVSFSGGRTSGYMTKRVLDTWQDQYDEIVVLFANTGQEHPKTLEFVHRCDVEFGFNTVWIEALIDPQHGKGTRFTVVDYETATTKGEHFEEVVKKYGIPFSSAPHCTRELKLAPLRSYARSIGWEAETYDQCVGIRVDEIDRMSHNAEKNRILYPLVKWNVTKTMVLDWWKAQPFDLEIGPLEGNCVWCWQKPLRKLMTLAKHNPEYFDFPQRMEKLYSMNGSMPKLNGNPAYFYRGGLRAEDIIARSREPFTQWTPDTAHQQIGLFSLDEMDYSNGCSESCEVEFV
jgi:hypothetical protein